MTGKLHAPQLAFRSALVGTVFATAAVAVGCSDDVTGAAEKALSGTYTLVSVNGGALPAVIDSSPGGPPRKVAASTMIFGGGSALVDVNDVILLGTRSDSAPYEYIVQYKVTGSQVSIGSFGACPPGASCIANDVGTWDASQVTLTSGQLYVGGRPATLVFQRTE